jgi:hypothetical protein
MATLVLPSAEEVLEITGREQTEMDALAFKLWQRASCEELPADQDAAEPEPWCHASCL